MDEIKVKSILATSAVAVGIAAVVGLISISPRVAMLCIAYTLLVGVVAGFIVLIYTEFWHVFTRRARKRASSNRR